MGTDVLCSCPCLLRCRPDDVRRAPSVPGSGGNILVWMDDARLCSRRNGLGYGGRRSAPLHRGGRGRFFRPLLVRVDLALLSRGDPCAAHCLHAWPCAFDSEGLETVHNKQYHLDVLEPSAVVCPASSSSTHRAYPLCIFFLARSD